MALPQWISTHDIFQVFGEEVGRLGGRVSDAFDDHERLFARSILPDEREVRRGDRLQGGVALLAAEHEIRVHPYVFRQVCANGAILAQAVQTRRIELPEWSGDVEAVFAGVRETVRACGAGEVFAGGVGEIRSALDQEADFALTVLPMLDKLPAGVRASMMGMIAGRFFAQPDRSRFALMNAVTAVARDTGDPDMKWRLEEIGGGVPTCKPVPRRPVGVLTANRGEMAHV
jgi:hypothetical protein